MRELNSVHYSNREAQVDLERKRSLGIYYTPRNAATILANWAIRSAEDNILEPSFGGCSILEAAVERLRTLGCNEPASNIFGFDVDVTAFSHLRRLVGPAWQSQFALKDFLAVQAAASLKVSSVIANPPFVSYHRMGASQRQSVVEWRRHNSPSFAKTASLWAYFLIHSLKFLKSGGRIAFILPMAAMASDYASSVLGEIERHFDRLALYQMNEQLFVQAGAGERTLVLLADNFTPDIAKACVRTEQAVSTVADLSNLVANGLSSVAMALRRLDTPGSPVIVQSSIERAIAKGAVAKLGQFAHVSIGEVVGDTKYFVKRMDEWEGLKIPPGQLRPLLTHMSHASGLRVTAKDVSMLYGPIPRLLSPSTKRLGKAVRQYLHTYPTDERNSNRTFAKRDPWYAVSYETNAAAFIASMSHRSPKILLNTAGISCGNGLYKLSPTSTKNKLNPWIAASSLTTLFRLSAELHARIRGSGALKLEPGDVKNLLLPVGELLTQSESRTLVNRLDTILRTGELESASRVADEVLLLGTGQFSNREVGAMRERLQDLMGERLPRLA